MVSQSINPINQSFSIRTNPPFFTGSAFSTNILSGAMHLPLYWRSETEDAFDIFVMFRVRLVNVMSHFFNGYGQVKFRF